jgi:sugar lactone lactonase YvrE
MTAKPVALFAILVLFVINAISLNFLTWGAQGDPTITTVAGGNVGDGRNVSEIFLNRPVDVVIDGDGNTYFTEDERVRRIDAVTGIVTTVAGNGVTGYSGDGGPATSASLNRPGGVALDAARNLLYVADFSNHRVRQVNLQTRTITTVAGDGFTDRDGRGRFRGDNGPATQASLNFPFGLALDSAGNLYIGDFGNNRVRKVDMGTPRIITTFAGDGDRGSKGDGGPATRASLNPTGLAFDADGNLYVADRNNHLIRKIERTTGNISTVAGDGWAQPLDLRDPRTFCSLGPGRGRLNVETGPARRVSLNFPQDVVVDAQGNVCIADTENQRIRRLSPDGQLTTVAGSGAWSLETGVIGGSEGDGGLATMAQLRSPTGVALNPMGNLLVADNGNNSLRLIDTDNIITTYAGSLASFGDGGLATEAGLYVPEAVAVDAEGNLFIGQSAVSRVRRVDARTGVITTVAGNGAIGFGGDDGLATEATLGGVAGLAVDSSGHLYISELVGQRVRQVNLATGMITTVAGNGIPGFSGDGGPATEAQLNFPRGIAVDDNYLYIADSCNHRIRRVDKRTGAITTVAGNGATDGPDNACYRSVCNPNDPCRGSFGGDGGPATMASLWSPFDVAVDRQGNLFIADTLNFRIRLVDGTGRITTIAGDDACGDRGDNGSASRAQFTIPSAVAVDGMGNILIADVVIQGGGNNRIRRINRSGRNPTIATVAGTGGFGFSGDGGSATSATMRVPSDIAVMPDGSFVFTDRFNHRVRRVR